MFCYVFYVIYVFQIVTQQYYNNSGGNGNFAKRLLLILTGYTQHDGRNR